VSWLIGTQRGWSRRWRWAEVNNVEVVRLSFAVKTTPIVSRQVGEIVSRFSAQPQTTLSPPLSRSRLTINAIAIAHTYRPLPMTPNAKTASPENSLATPGTDGEMIAAKDLAPKKKAATSKSMVLKMELSEKFMTLAKEKIADSSTGEFFKKNEPKLLPSFDRVAVDGGDDGDGMFCGR
jgi:hypothetical protein